MNWRGHMHDALAACSVGIGCALVMLAACCLAGEAWVYLTR